MNNEILKTGETYLSKDEQSEYYIIAMTSKNVFYRCKKIGGHSEELHVHIDTFYQFVGDVKKSKISKDSINNIFAKCISLDSNCDQDPNCDFMYDKEVLEAVIRINSNGKSLIALYEKIEEYDGLYWCLHRYVPSCGYYISDLFENGYCEFISKSSKAGKIGDKFMRVFKSSDEGGVFYTGIHGRRILRFLIDNEYDNNERGQWAGKILPKNHREYNKDAIDYYDKYLK